MGTKQHYQGVSSKY